MTFGCEKFPRLMLFGLAWALLSVTVLVLAGGGVAHAADSTAQVWQGEFKSSALQKVVSIQLRYDAAPPELRFEPMGCSVGLKPVSPDSRSRFSVVRYKENEMSGPYCGTWVGGTIEIRPVGYGQSAATMKLVSSNGRSQVEATIRPASGTR